MRRHQVTQGATMIVVVLFTLLLLAGILAATLRLSLGSRQNTADQAATLQAQYGAESKLAVVQSRLLDIQKLLSKDRPVAGGKDDNFNVPGTTTPAVVKTYAENFCGKSGSAAWVATDEFKIARNDNDVTIFNDAQVCNVDSSSSFTTEQSGVLADFLKQDVYSLLPDGEGPRPVTDRTARLNWWNNLLSSTDKTDITNAKYQIRPLRVVQLSPTNYRFYIQPTTVRVKGEQNNATRVLVANRAQSGGWWFQIILPSLLEDVLMTNHHRAKPTGAYSSTGAPGVNFDAQIFDGSIHTNEKFLFTRTSSAQFLGKVSSVGCTDLPPNGLPTSGDCGKTAGVYLGTPTQDKYGRPTITNQEYNPPITSSNPSKSIVDTITASPRTVKFVQQGTPPATDYDKTDFSAAYKPLPTNENDQKAAAQNGGLSLAGDILGVELVAGGEDGKSLTSYVAGDPRLEEGTWTEPSPTYQYIRTLKNQTTQNCSWTSRQDYSDVYQGKGKFNPDDLWNSTPDTYKGTVLVLKDIYDGRYYYNVTRYWRYLQSCKDVNATVVGDEYRFGQDKKLYKKNTSDGWDFVKDKFNGVIYGDSFNVLRGPPRKDGGDNGALDNVPPAVASFAGITIASTNDIKITSDLTLSDTPCAFSKIKATPPCNKKPKNILGIYSQNGDIILSTDTKKDLNLHASIIASTGQVTAEKYDTRPDQGNVKLIGSLIENWYGAFGQLGNPDNGYGRQFTYDQRLAEGIIPPFFPVSPRWQTQTPSPADTNITRLVTRQTTIGNY